MGHALVILFLLTSCCFPPELEAQSEELTASGLSEFLPGYEKQLQPLDAAYADLENEKLPLRDELGKLLGRRPIENRRQALASLRDTVHRLEANPQDLVLTTELFLKTESLTDDLFDLSQTAYDNDREELGNRFSDLLTAIDNKKDLIESYALSLAGEKQERIRELEKENRDLQRKLKEAAEHAKTKEGEARFGVRR